MRGQPGHNTRPHAGLPPNFPWYGRIYDVTTDPSFDLQGTCFIDVFGLFLDMLFMGVCTTRHWSNGAGIKYLYCISPSLTEISPLNTHIMLF